MCRAYVWVVEARKRIVLMSSHKLLRVIEKRWNCRYVQMDVMLHIITAVLMGDLTQERVHTKHTQNNSPDLTVQTHLDITPPNK